MSRLVATAVKLPLAWAICYTAGLPAPLRETRRAEIRSDTFEHAHDPTLEHRPVHHAWDIIQSFLRGLPDDLRWRAVNTPGGLWIIELISLSLALSIFVGTFAHAQTDGLPRATDRIGVSLAGAALGLAVGIWCSVSLRSGDSGPYVPQSAATEVTAETLRGSPMALQTFARFSGWLLIAAGIFQSLSFAAGRAGGFDYFDGTVAMLNTIADAQGWFVAAVITSGLTTALLLPFFLYLLLTPRASGREWSVLAAGLFGIHLAVSLVGLALFAVLVPLADDFASASGANAETLRIQADNFLRLRFIVIQPAGVAMAAAIALASYQMRIQNIGPRWLSIVGFGHALFWLPPLAGDFILVFPFFIVWTVATGLVLVRRSNERLPLAAPVAA